MDMLTRVSVEYKTLPGWCCSTEAVRCFDDLPSQAKDYIHFIENFLQVPGTLLCNASDANMRSGIVRKQNREKKESLNLMSEITIISIMNKREFLRRRLVTSPNINFIKGMLAILLPVDCKLFNV